MNIKLHEVEDRILQSQTPVLIFFFAPWCGPCKIMKPVIEELEQESQHVRFIKLNVEENQHIANKFMVFKLPTFLLYHNGKKLKQLTGLQEKEDLSQHLKHF